MKRTKPSHLRSVTSRNMPWVMHMRWLDLLFAHWRVSPDLLRPHIPNRLEIETYDGSAWVGVVAFRMENIRPRYLPPLPRISAFSEINLRTYVNDGVRSGVRFITLDAPHWLVNEIARRWFHLNYKEARIRCERDRCWVDYDAQRNDGTAQFTAHYRPIRSPFHAAAGTLEHWLCERYRLFSGGGLFPICKAEIEHAPWPLQRVKLEIEMNTMGDALGIHLNGNPDHALYAARLDTHIGRPRRLSEQNVRADNEDCHIGQCVTDPRHPDAAVSIVEP